MLSADEEKQAKVIFNLLKEATSQSVVREFLRDHGASVSGNWDELYADRLLPALRDKKITIKALGHLLEEVEEHGRQHVFLFKCDPEDAKSLLKEARIRGIASDSGLEHLLDNPLYIGMPSEPTVVDLRLTQAPNGSGPLSLTIKICECRETSKLLDVTYDEESGRRSKIYQVTKKRALSIIHLHSNGLLEMRIASRDNSTKYSEQIAELNKIAGKFFLMDVFNAVSLSNAKSTLFEKRDELKDRFRYSTTTAKNDTGYALNVASGKLSQNLLADNGSSKAITEFIKNKGFVTGSNIWFIMPEDPGREIHVILNGEPNEFAVPAACTSREYSYVIETILSLN